MKYYRNLMPGILLLLFPSSVQSLQIIGFDEDEVQVWCAGVYLNVPIADLGVLPVDVFGVNESNNLKVKVKNHESECLVSSGDVFTSNNKSSPNTRSGSVSSRTDKINAAVRAVGD